MPIISSVKIQPKVFALLLALFALFAVFAVAQYFVEESILPPSFRNFEQQAARQDMARVAGILDREIDSLGVTVRDWGNWVETWNYMRDRKARYVEANLGEAAMASLQVGSLPQRHPLLSAIHSGRPVSGLLSTNRGPMLFVLAPILNGQFQGPYRGMVPMG